MKKAVKNDREVQEERPLPAKKKKLAKPWELEFKVVDPELTKAFAWFSNKWETGVWIKDIFYKFLSVDHGLRELRKITRSYDLNSGNTHWRFAGRDFRLVNVDTGIIVPLKITKDSIDAAGEERGDSESSTLRDPKV